MWIMNQLSDKTISTLVDEFHTIGTCPVCGCGRHGSISFFMETKSILGGLSDDQKAILNKTGYWVCGNPNCLEKDGSRTKLAEIEAVSHGIMLKGYKQAIHVNFERLENKCIGHEHKPCGYENFLNIETEKSKTSHTS